MKLLLHGVVNIIPDRQVTTFIGAYSKNVHNFLHVGCSKLSDFYAETIALILKRYTFFFYSSNFMQDSIKLKTAFLFGFGLVPRKSKQIQLNVKCLYGWLRCWVGNRNVWSDRFASILYVYICFDENEFVVNSILGWI